MSQTYVSHALARARRLEEREELQALIERKREGIALKTKPQRPRVATEDTDLLAALKASIHKAEGKRKRALAA